MVSFFTQIDKLATAQIAHDSIVNVLLKLMGKQ
jgi:hypothetical protein